MGGVFGFISENSIVNDFEKKKKYFDLVSQRGTEYFEYKSDNSFFGYTNSSIRNLHNPDSLVKLPHPQLGIRESLISGLIQYVDRFGNLISNIPGNLVAEKSWGIILGDRLITSATTYSDVAVGQAVTFIGSHGWVEIAVNQGSAKEKLQLSFNDKLTVKLLP